MCCGAVESRASSTLENTLLVRLIQLQRRRIAHAIGLGIDLHAAQLGDGTFVSGVGHERSEVVRTACTLTKTSDCKARRVVMGARHFRLLARILQLGRICEGEVGKGRVGCTLSVETADESRQRGGIARVGGVDGAECLDCISIVCQMKVRLEANQA